MATKTPYKYVGNSNVNTSRIPSHCQPKKVWLLLRHGTRNPNKAEIVAIKDKLPKLLTKIKEQQRLCDRDLRLLESFKADVVADEAKSLHAEGEVEMMAIAERLTMRFPTLITEDYHDEWYRFRSTDEERSRKSQFFFASGLFGRNVAYEVKFESSIRPHDPVIRFYKLCDKWLKTVKNNPETYLERQRFEESDLFRIRVLDDLSDKIGFNVSLDDLDAIYAACTFGQAWHPDKTSPWCGLLGDDQLDMLAYRSELKTFYVSGYGNRLNYDQACVVAEDILQHFDSVVNDNDKTKGVFYFSHSGALLKLATYLRLMNISQDEFPRHDNYDPDRRWRASIVDPFGSNIGLVLLQCEDNQSDEAVFKVALYLNEHLIPIPGCESDQDELCSYEAFKDLIASYNNDHNGKCDFQAICT